MHFKRSGYCSKMNWEMEARKDRDEIFVLKPLNHKQLAQMYGVSWITFQNWIKRVEPEVGKKTGHFYHVPQVRIIFKLFGIPQKINMAVNEVEDLFRN